MNRAICCHNAARGGWWGAVGVCASGAGSGEAERSAKALPPLAASRVVDVRGACQRSSGGLSPAAIDRPVHYPPRALRDSQCGWLFGGRSGWLLGLAFAAILWPGPPRLAAGESTALAQRFRTEAPEGWKRWRHQLAKLDARWRERLVWVAEDGTEKVDPSRERELQFCYNDRLLRLSFFGQSENGERIEEVEVIRDRYRFTAERRGESPFVVTELRPGLRADQPVPYPKVLQLPYLLQWEDLGELLKDPCFVIGSVVAVESGGAPRVRVDFTYDPKGPRARRFVSGWVVFAPEDDWAIQQYRIRTLEGYQSEARLEYGARKDGFQPVKKWVRNSLDTTGVRVEARETYEFVHYERREIPEEFFTFTALGLPELNPGVPGGTISSSSWFWVVNLGIVFVIIGVALRARLSRGREGMAAAGAGSAGSGSEGG